MQRKIVNSYKFFKKNPPTLTYSTLAVSIPLYWTGDIFSSVEFWRFFARTFPRASLSIPLSAFSWGNSSPLHFLFLTLAIPLSLSVTLSLYLSLSLSRSIFLPLSPLIFLSLPSHSSSVFFFAKLWPNFRTFIRRNRSHFQQIRACHGWSRCNGICQVFWGRYVYGNKRRTYCII